jgi:hypothetical protein
VVPLQGLQLTHQGTEVVPSPVYYSNPYVPQTQSYTQIAPQYFSRYFDAPPMTATPSRHDFPSQQQGVDHDYESEKDGSSVTSRSRGKGNAGGPDDGEKVITSHKGKRSRAFTEDIDEDEEDETPRRKIPRKTEVACDFCRRKWTQISVLAIQLRWMDRQEATL